MYTIVENGMTIAAAGTAAYVGLGWMMEGAVKIFEHMARLVGAL